MALSINMKLSNEQKVRPKFLAGMLLILSLVLFIGGWHTVGLWMPMIIVSLILLTTTSNHVIGIYPVRVYQIATLVLFIVGAITLVLFGVAMSVSWFITAIIFSVSFKIVRILLGVIGFAGLFTNA